MIHLAGGCVILEHDARSQVDAVSVKQVMPATRKERYGKFARVTNVDLSDSSDPTSVSRGDSNNDGLSNAVDSPI